MESVEWRVDGEKLKKLRDSMHLTQKQLGKRARKYLDGVCITARAIRRYERSHPCCPDYIKAIAQVLEVDYQVLLRTNEPITTFITGANETEEALLEDSFACLQKLFQDPAQLGELDDIETWLNETRHAELTGDPWRDIYGVHHVGTHVIGVAYLSANLQFPWAFGNYFGVLNGWRDQCRSERFLEDTVDYLQKRQPYLKGIVFEVELVELDYLTSIASNLDHIVFDERLMFNLRSIRRVKSFFEPYGARVVLGRDGRPFPYLQPAWKDMNASNEREMILMVNKVGGSRVEDEELRQILDFIYDEVYMDLSGKEYNAVSVPDGYDSYILDIKARVKAKAQEGLSLGPFPQIKGIYQLFRLAKRHGLADELDL
jgi:transcriptional regulator with XRE-family HTH domain